MDTEIQKQEFQEIQDGKTTANSGFSRRQFIGMGAMAGAGVVLASALSGCSSNDLNLDTDYLPMGSVVKIAGDEEKSLYRMIIARRPIVSKYKDENGEWHSMADKPIFDYAGLIWTIGPVSDLSDHLLTGEIVCFQRSDITEVAFVGWQNDQEKEANAALSAGMNTTKTSPELLYDLGQKLLTK